MVECIASVLSSNSSSAAHDPARDVAHVQGYFDFEPPASFELLAIAAREGAECVGAIIGFVDRSLGHPQLQEPDLVVRPSHRRMGVGRRLVEAAFAQMHAPGSTIVASSGSEGAASFARSLGATMFQRTVHSALTAAEADLERVSALASCAPAGYDLVAWDGLVPTAVATELIDLVQWLRSAPNGNDIPIPSSLEEQRAWAESFERSGLQWWTAAARHVETETLAAMTDLQVRPDGTASVLHTVTRPEHRRRGLARWLKASLLTRFFDDPAARAVVTQNAETNTAAIAANRALGLRHTATVSSWRLRKVDTRRA